MQLPLRSYTYTILFLLNLLSFPALGQGDISDIIDRIEKLHDEKRERPEALDEALELLDSTRNSKLYTAANCEEQGQVLHKIGVSYYFKKDYAKASKFWTEEVIPHLSDCSLVPPDKLANTYYTVARAYRLLDNPFGEREALEACLEILSNYSKARPNDLAYKFTDAGILFANLEDYAKAEQYFIQAENQLKKAENLSGGHALRLYCQWAKLSTDKKEYKEALALVNRAEIIANEGEKISALNYSTAMFSKARVLYHKEDYDEALAYNQKGYDFDLARNDSTFLIRYLELFANIYKKKGQYQTAKDILQQLLDFSPQPSDDVIDLDRSGTLENLGDIAVLEKDWLKALEQYQQAVKYLLPHFKPKDLWEVPVLHDQPIGTPKDLRRVLSLQARALEGYYMEKKEKRLLVYRAELYQTLDIIVTQLGQKLSLAASKRRLMADVVIDYEGAIATNLALYEQTKQPSYLNEAYRFSAKNKALLLLAGLQNERALTYARIPRELLEKEAELQANFFRFQWFFSRQTDAAIRTKYQDSLFQVSEAYRRFTSSLEQEYPSYYELKYALPEVDALPGLQEQLSPNALLVEYFIGEEELFIFAISAEGVEYKRLKKAVNFESSILRLRQLMEAGEIDALGQLAISAHQHYQLLLADFLEQRQVDQLIIIPDGPLMTIAFDALLTEPVGERKLRNWPFLLKRMPVSTLYSSRLFNRPLRKNYLQKADRRFGGFGIEYDTETLDRLQTEEDTSSNIFRDLGRLKYSDDEVLAIGDILDGDVWLNHEATLQQFLVHSADYQILHLAMHGIVDEEDPLQSALIFSAETDTSEFLLRAAQLYELSLPAEMTVLSACNTAYGQIVRGEGIRSLARAFTYAGSNSLLASLWAASDQATQQIMIEFYQQLKQGVARDVALQMAKLKYLEEAPTAYLHPSYWAPFSLIGERGPIQRPWYKRFLWLGILLLIGGFFASWYYWRLRQN